MYTVEELQQLMQCVSQNHIEKLKIKTEDGTLTIVGHTAPPPPMPMPMASPVPMPAILPAELPSVPTASTQAPEPAPAAAKGTVVKAPLVGTFYAAASPDQPPFIKVGDTVKKGDVLFIIESMKLMNEVQSEVDGVVAEIFVGNAEAVEYDQPILRVE